MRGEITPAEAEEKFEVPEEHFIQAITDAITHKSNENSDLIRSLILPNIVCHVLILYFYY